MRAELEGSIARWLGREGKPAAMGLTMIPLARPLGTCIEQ